MELAEGLLELVLGVHDDGAVPGDGLLEGLAGDEEKADAVLAGLDADFVAAIKEDKGAVVGSPEARCRAIDRFGGNGKGPEALQNFPEPAKT